MRIIFAGATELGLRCIEQLYRDNQKIVGILPLLDEFNSPTASQYESTILQTQFKMHGAALGIPVFEVAVDTLLGDLIVFLNQHPADLMVVQADSDYLIPTPIRKLFPRGVVGIHTSLLPLYRGASSLFWAMITGATETGVSLFILADGIDTGPILDQRRFPIERTDYLADLMAKVEQAAFELLTDSLPAYEAETLLPRAQTPDLTPDQYETRYTTWRARIPEDGQIDWGQSTHYIHRLIRAQSHPYSGAYFDWQGVRIHVWRAEFDRERLPMGEVGIIPRGHLLVGTGSGLLRLTDISLTIGDVTHGHNDALTFLKTNLLVPA